MFRQLPKANKTPKDNETIDKPNYWLGATEH